MINQQIYKERRERFLAELKGSAAIIPAASLVTHHADCEYPFRQDSDFWYLTGFDEPEAIALFLPHRPEGEKYLLLFRQKRELLKFGVVFGGESKVLLISFMLTLLIP